MDDTTIDVELDSAVGPRVVVHGQASQGEILSELPNGWTVHEDGWSAGVQTQTGGWSYPLVREEAIAPDENDDEEGS